jgi:hypothetical protein
MRFETMMTIVVAVCVLIDWYVEPRPVHIIRGIEVAMLQRTVGADRFRPR